MKTITIYVAHRRGDKYNAVYPEKHEITSVDDLREAAQYDHVFAEYRDNHRSIKDFISSDCLPFDAFPGVSFYVVYSRHHMKQKGKYSPRPRFHIIFPINPVTDGEVYRALKESVIDYFPYFDTNAKDAARFFFGVKDPVVELYGGDRDGCE